MNKYCKSALKNLKMVKVPKGLKERILLAIKKEHENNNTRTTTNR